MADSKAPETPVKASKSSSGKKDGGYKLPGYLINGLNDSWDISFFGNQKGGLSIALQNNRTFEVWETNFNKDEITGATSKIGVPLDGLSTYVKASLEGTTDIIVIDATAEEDGSAILLNVTKNDPILGESATLSTSLNLLRKNLDDSALVKKRLDAAESKITTLEKENYNLKNRVKVLEDTQLVTAFFKQEDKTIDQTMKEGAIVCQGLLPERPGTYVVRFTALVRYGVTGSSGKKDAGGKKPAKGGSKDSGSRLETVGGTHVFYRGKSVLNSDYTDGTYIKGTSQTVSATYLLDVSEDDDETTRALAFQIGSKSNPWCRCRDASIQVLSLKE